MIRRLATVCGLPLFVSFLLAGCGGGGSDSTPAPPSAATPAPTALSYPSPQTASVGATMPAITPSVTGSVASYSIAPALPDGLSIDTATGAISGVPITATAPATYTVTATNAGGSTNFALSLKVIGVDVVSGSLARIAAQGSPIAPEVVVRPRYFDVGTLYALVNDPNGLFRVPVTVTALDDGSYALRLTTNPAAPAGLVAGTLTFSLCRDAGCSSTQEVPGVTVPYSVRVMAAATPWPGDNLTALAALPGAPDWGTFQGNAGHTGHVPASVNPDRFSLRWKTAGNKVNVSFNLAKQNLVTSGGLLFVASSGWMDGGMITARRELDGAEAWRFDLAGLPYPVANPAAVANGVVYFAAGYQGDAYLFARNAVDGSAVFRADISSQWEAYYAPTIGPNGAVYANAGTYGGLFAFNAQGSQLFFSPQSQVTDWTPAVNATGVYAYTGDRLQVVDPATGVVSVTIPDPTYTNYIYDTGGAPVLGNAALGSVFAASYSNSVLNGGAIGNTLTNFRTTTGTIAWQFHGVYPTTPAYRAGVLYAVNQNPLRMEARAEADGAVLWSWTPDAVAETSFVSEVLITDNLLFLSTNTTTHAIDLRTHRSVWSYPASGKLSLSANGILYIHNSTDLIAINLK
jgi:hypothetical protein